MDKKLTDNEITEFKQSLAEYFQTATEKGGFTDGEVTATVKLTKLKTSVKNLAQRIRTSVTDQWYALCDAPKKRKFERWCRENEVYGVHLVWTGKRVDYDAIQRVIQETITAEQKNNVIAMPEQEL